MLMILLLISCFCVVLSTMLYIEPVNIVENRFGWLGDQNWDFWMDRVWEFVCFWTVRRRFAWSEIPSLKRAALWAAQNLKCQFAQARAKRTLSEQNL